MSSTEKEDVYTLKSIREDLDKVVAHQKTDRSITTENNVMLNEIKLALIGSSFTDNKGLVHEVKILKDKNEETSSKLEILTNDVKIGKTIIFVIFTGMIALLFKVFGKSIGL